MIKLDSPQPTYTIPSPEQIPDVEDDKPVGNNINEGFQGELPPIVFGAATLSTTYNSQSSLETPDPFRTVRLALRYGIRAFDTSPFYGASEIILGSILKALEPEFPRSSYVLLTKCGRYGIPPEDFDYSPATVRASVLRSLKRLNTDYLDVVYLHDVEFVCTPVHPLPDSSGTHTAVFTDDKAAREWGLADDQLGKVHGPGDQIILDAIAELKKLKDEGLIKAIGISGYPLPTLLRLSLLALHSSQAPVEQHQQPIDYLMSYSNLNLQNTSFLSFVSYFKTKAHIKYLLTASPLNMGLLTPSPPPWHPAPKPLLEIIKNKIVGSDTVKEWPGGLPNLALGYAMRMTDAFASKETQPIPTVVGLSSLREVHECVAVWREVVFHATSFEEETVKDRRSHAEQAVRDMMDDDGKWLNHCWKSGL